MYVTPVYVCELHSFYHSISVPPGQRTDFLHGSLTGCSDHFVYISGIIYDTTGSYTGVFYLHSSCYLTCGLLYGSIIYINKRRPRWCFPLPGETIPLMSNGASAHIAQPKESRDFQNSYGTPPASDLPIEDKSKLPTGVAETSH